MTSTSILALAELPESILILGGGYIGCEFASMLAIMGVAVTIIQRGQALLPLEDANVSSAVASALESDGVSVRLGAAAESVSRSNGTVTVTLSDGSTAEAAEILVALGREPVTAGLGLQGPASNLQTRD
ncbi:FAD-dependent oxidoreductase [Arthrobacter alpinus]|nr:FAD-dependent oxidoreductase [Arthrobacter alpinus]